MTTRDIDVLVIGGGNAGLCAAIAGCQTGATVEIVECGSQAERGGNSRHTRNLRVAHEGPTALLAGEYFEREYMDDLMRVTDGKTDEALAAQAIAGSRELPAWLESLGVKFQPPLAGTLGLSNTNPFFLGGGKALLNTLYAKVQSLGVKTRYQTEIDTLEISHENGRRRFVAAQGRERSAPFRVGAKSVVVCSGGFESNLEWLAREWGEAARNFIVRGTKNNQGKMLKNLIDHGAQTVADPAQCHAVAIDARSPRHDGGIATRIDCIPFSIVVNTECERFYDEGEDIWPKRYAIWGRLVARQPGQIAYAISDSQSEGLFMPTLFEPTRADSIDGLARQLGLDARRLRETVDGYNRCAPESAAFDGRRLDGCATAGLRPRKSNWARKINRPPFFAYPLRPGITFTYLGVRVDGDARVIRDDGRPYDNIFAAGEVMAGNILGQGYLAGIGMTIGGVFGKTAGAAAASQSAVAGNG